MRRSKHLARRERREEFIFEWDFVFPDETPMPVCKGLFKVFLASITERNPRMAGVIMNYPVAICGRVYNTDRFQEGEIIDTAYIRSLERIQMTLFDRIALWAWWPSMVRTKYRVITEDGDIFTIWLRDASVVTLEILETCIYDEIDDTELALVSQI